MHEAQAPTLNNSAPPVNLMGDFHLGQGQVGLPDITGLITVAFTLLFIVWVVYTIVIIYHWFRYRHQSWFAVPAVVLHLFVSGTIFLYILANLR